MQCRLAEYEDSVTHRQIRKIAETLSDSNRYHREASHAIQNTAIAKWIEENCKHVHMGIGAPLSPGGVFVIAPLEVESKSLVGTQSRSCRAD